MSDYNPTNPAPQSDDFALDTLKKAALAAYNLWQGGGSGGPPTGAASGDLAGSYPGPTVAKINGAAISSGAAAQLVKVGVAGTNVASGTNLNLSGGGDYFHITGTTNVHTITDETAGVERTCVFDGVLSVISGANILGPSINTVAGDVIKFRSQGSGVWKIVGYISGAISPVDYLNTSSNATFNGFSTWDFPTVQLTISDSTASGFAGFAFDLGGYCTIGAAGFLNFASGSHTQIDNADIPANSLLTIGAAGILTPRDRGAAVADATTSLDVITQLNALLSRLRAQNVIAP